jgi:hypothetical protein
MNEDSGLCSSFKASDFNYSRNRRALKAESGLFGLFCARHEVPLSFVDMTTGERYAYCDALLRDVFLKHGSSREVHLFYDINCKYSVNLKVMHWYTHSY